MNLGEEKEDQMRIMLRVGVAAVALLASVGLANADCDFHSEPDFQGDKLGLTNGECAILVDGHEEDAACEGMKTRRVSGWNDRIQSFKSNMNSRAVLYGHVDADRVDPNEEQSIEVPGTAAVLPEGWANHASVVACLPRKQ
jgi:hypothetical protein